MISNSVEETRNFGKELAKSLWVNNVIALYGELGSGKTQIVKGICHQLGVKETINSPTFIILNEYSASQISKVFHFDFFRLRTSEEIIDIGFTDYLDRQESSLILIEWPELAEPFLPKDTIKILISHIPEKEFSREIEIIT